MGWGKRLLSVLVGLPGVLFVIFGMQWLVDPAGIASSLGLELQTGMGLSTQIGDLSAFFLVVGLTTLFAVITRRRIWYYPPVMLLLLAAVGRTVAWFAHGAAFVPETITFEVVVAVILLVGSRYLPERD